MMTPKFLMYNVLIMSSLLISLQGIAQKQQDVELWTGVQVNKQFSKRWYINVADQIRLDNNVQHIKGNLLTFESGYKIFKFWTVALGTRYTIRNKANSARFYFDNVFSYKLKRLSFVGRARLQLDKNLESTKEWEPTLRTRLHINYNPKGLKNWTFLLASCELFWGLSPAKLGLYRYRAGVGATYQFSKQTAISLQYLVQDKPNDTRVQFDHIAHISFRVQLDYDKPKKDDDKKDGDKKDKDKDNKEDGKKDKKDDDKKSKDKDKKDKKD